MTIILIILGIISIFVLVFGVEGRGTWSQSIAIVGGLMWLGSVIWSFYSFGFKGGVIYLIGTFIWGAIITNILKPILNPRGR